VIRNLVDEAVQAGARCAEACKVLGLPARTLERWAHRSDDGRHGPKHTPANKLSTAERNKVLAIATSPEFRDQSPKQIVPTLVDRGVYVASESSFYRVLHEQGLQRHRGRARPPTPRPRGHAAHGPWQLGAWDITYLRSLVRGQFYYLYLVVDVWSRKIVGWDVHDAESTEFAADLIEKIRKENPDVDLCGWVLHSDNGGPMKGATMLATMHKLGIVPSFSRPRVSDDNAYAEALFRTLKYCPQYPSKGFAAVDDARAWVGRFVAWYNDEHLHSGIGFVTPSSRHAGDDIAILGARRTTYEAARKQQPARWSRHARSWSRPEIVTLLPESEISQTRSDQSDQIAEKAAAA
jgi:transposase InsO family protein